MAGQYGSQVLLDHAALNHPLPGLTQLAWLSPTLHNPQSLAVGWPGSACLAESLL